MINKPMPQVCTRQTSLIAALTLLFFTGTTPTLPLVVGCHHLTLAIPGSNYSHCILVSQFSDYSSHCEVSLQRRVIMELFNNGRAPLKVYFSQDQ